MKYRIVILILLATLLSACNLTLAEDVTPPPGYIPPTPMPTLVLVPPQTPNITNGKAIYAEKCAPCHGDTGLGDGEKGIQLGVTVPAFALSEIARPASPAQWYTTVTRGKMERFMPPFNSLNDQQRWDVVAYIMSLHTNEEEIQRGKKIFEENCPNCSTDYFKDLNKMSPLSTVTLARIVRLGNDDIKAFGENLSDEEMWAVAEYLRSLTYDRTPLAAPTPVPATETPLPADTVTPSAEGTPVGTEQVQVTSEAITPVAEGFGSVSGSIDNKSGNTLPENLTITLRGYQHDFENPSAGTQEILTLEGTVAQDGTFVFENVEMPENRIFLAEVTHEGIDVSSDYVIVEAGQTAVTLPPLVLYDVSNDTSLLTMDELDMFLTVKEDGTFEIVTLYNFRNASESMIVVAVNAQEEIPFLKFPVEAQGLGYEAVQDSAPFVSTADGFAMNPNEMPYGILAYSSLTKEKETSISQSVVLPVSVARIFVPDGMEVEGDQVTPEGPQSIQNSTYQTYSANNLQAGDILKLTITGSPKNAPAGTDTPKSNNSLLIGVGGLGIALLLAGVWMYVRDRRQTNDDYDEEDDEFESAEDAMDAIIALDDLYRAKKISEEAYQKRRAELKDILKELM